jgi:FMN reductase
MLVVTLGGSPSQRSRSGVLLDHAKRWLNQQGVEVVSYQVRDFPAEDLLHARFDSPKIIDLLQQIENADGLVIATRCTRPRSAAP